MANHAVPTDVNHVVLCWASHWESRIERCASGCESCAMLSQSFGITMWTCASGCESWWTMLIEWLWIMLCYAVSVVVNHGELCSASGCESCWAMVNQWLWNIAEPKVDKHGVLYWVIGFESFSVMLRQWLWIMVRYADTVVCESWCAELYQWWWIIVSYAQPVVVNHGELCWANGCETLSVMLNSVCGNHGVLC